MRTSLKKDELVKLQTKQHWFILVRPTLIFIVLTSIAIASVESEYGNIFSWVSTISFFVLLYRIIARNKNIWVVTNLRVIDESGVFSSNSKESPLDKINNVSFRQPFIGRIFGYGHVNIQTAAEMGSTTHAMINDPKRLKETITKLQDDYVNQQIRSQAKNLADAISTNTTSPLSSNNISEELIRLHELKEKGILTEEEFISQKKKLLG